MNAQALPDLEVVGEMLDQLTEVQLRLLAAYRRLSPPQRTALLRLVADKERLATRAHDEDPLVTAFQRLTLAQQATLIQLVGRNVEDAQHFRGRKRQDGLTTDVGW